MLSAWEAGSSLPPELRSLPLLAAAQPHLPVDSLRELSLGAFNARVLALRTRLFGDRLEAIVVCPACSETMELTLPADRILDEAPTPSTQEVAVEIDGYRLRLRRLTPVDLVAQGSCSSVEEIRLKLLDCCLLEARHTDRLGPLAAEDLPEAVQRVAGTALAEADPNAAPGVEVECGVCGHEWTAPIDVGVFLWHDLQRWSLRLLDEVHVLARAYGWTEPDVLALPPGRRSHYLGLNYG